MQLDDLHAKLKLNQALTRQALAKPDRLSAAVLLPVIEKADTSLEIWLTRRPDYLKHHPGQISLPGGKLEPQDPNLYACALRETHEEIGTPPWQWDPVCTLSALTTTTGFEISPFVASYRFNPDSQPIVSINQAEVAELIKIPLERLLYQTEIRAIQVQLGQRMREVLGFYWQDDFIWGATAAILNEFKQRLL